MSGMSSVRVDAPKARRTPSGTGGGGAKTKLAAAQAAGVQPTAVVVQTADNGGKSRDDSSSKQAANLYPYEVRNAAAVAASGRHAGGHDTVTGRTRLPSGSSDDSGDSSQRLMANGAKWRSADETAVLLPSPSSAVSLSNEDELWSVSVRALVHLCCGLPLGALLVCVSLSILLHYEESTVTHCNVSNYLPSVSAAISDLSPERYVWRVAIALHSLPRFLTGYLYHNFYKTCPLRPVSSVVDTNWILYLGYLLIVLQANENFFLLLLSTIGSTENHELHVLSFSSFVVFGMAYMLLNTYLFDHSGRRRSFSQGELSFQYKATFVGVAALCVLLSGYFYYRHNAYCESGVYTLFALCEYGYIVSVAMYNCTVAIDFHDKKMCITSANPLESMLTTTVRTAQPARKDT